MTTSRPGASGKGNVRQKDLFPNYEIVPPPPGASPAVPLCVRTPEGDLLFAHRYARPGLAATVVLRDRSRDAYLLVRRGHDPYRGHWSFPGGFIESGRESIEETAAREVLEETGIRLDPKEMRLVDVRSRPDRDPRDHVADVGYYAEVDSAQAEARDETDEVRWATAEELDGLPLAFDHAELWRRAREARQS